MNKRFGFILLIVLAAIFSLHDCKPEKPSGPPNNDPDSLYVGTPYTITPPQYGFPPIPVTAATKSMTYEGVQLGRMLFYDPVLSSDSLFSCSSCHKQQYAFADGGKVLSQNFFGPTKRNTPPLFNMVWMQNFFWDGRATSLPAQAGDAMIHEMNYTSPVALSKLGANPTYVRLFKKAFGRPGTITDDKVQQALAEFMLTLISSESKFDSFARGQAVLSPSELAGFNLFLADTINHGGDCFHCHASNSAGSDFRMVDNRFHNNALDSSNSFAGFPDLGLGAIDGNELDNGKFKTPQIRNIALTGPYMRNGRFATLDQVVNFYNDSLTESPTVDPFMKTAYRGGLHYLTPQNKQDLIAFLNSLTDYKFITNPAYSNPFH